MANNGKRYSREVKNAARAMRLSGNSLDRIVERFGISKATAWLWLRDVKISAKARNKLKRNSDRGRKKGREILRKQREDAKRAMFHDAENLLCAFPSSDSKDFYKIIAAIIFWCKGYKRGVSQGVVFINSDPILLQVFLMAIRTGFDIHEDKLTARPHLHEYHDCSKQINFWSRVTGIPVSRIKKPYIKPHTKIRKRDGYPGCLSVRYGDARLARTLDALYHTFGKKYGGVV